MNTGRKRVVFVLPTLTMGGAERVLITLMNGLDRNRFDPHLVALDNKGPLIELINPNITVHSLGGVKLRFALPPLVKKLNQLMPDIVVSTMAGMNFTVLLAKPFLKKRTKLIVREAGDPAAIIASQKFPAMVRTAYKKLYPRADLVIAPAQFLIDTFKNELGLDMRKFALLYNPVNLENMTALPAITEKRRKTVHFVAAGRLHKQKGFDRLIDALPRLKHALQWTLSIYGVGPEQADLERRIAQNNLGANVKLMGLTIEPLPIYGAADAVLLPSRTEGLPNVALEALAAGTKVIAIKDAGGINEIVKFSDGVTIAPDFDAFLRAMEQVKPDPATEYRPSLLPDQFGLESVLNKFSSLFEDKASNP